MPGGASARSRCSPTAKVTVRRSETRHGAVSSPAAKASGSCAFAPTSRTSQAPRPPPPTLRHVLAGARGACEVLDVGANAPLPEAFAARRLTAPCLVSDLPTVTFAVGEHLERAEVPRGIDTRRVRDEISPADHFVDEHVACELTAVHGFPDPQAPVRGLGSGEPRHLIALRGAQRENDFGEGVRLRKKRLLGGLHRQIFG